VDFRGEKRKNQTHESTTDPDPRLYTKSSGSQAKLSYMGHVLIENRHKNLSQFNTAALCTSLNLRDFLGSTLGRNPTH
jgi:hypothetical protein